jgi:hypothetical protein
MRMTLAVHIVAGALALAFGYTALLCSVAPVITSLTTIRPPAAGTRWLDIGSMLVGLAVGLTFLTFGLEARMSPRSIASVATPA